MGRRRRRRERLRPSGLAEPQINAGDLDLLIALTARVGLGEKLRSEGT
jgi:hypothetical protein